MIEGALVLEGGALRCMFTAGVLDVLMEEGIELSYVIGVSAGAICGMNYVSKQPGRTFQVNETYLHDKRFFSFSSLLKNRVSFNFTFLFGELSTRLLPFDFQSFYQSNQRYIAVATRCRSGKEEYFEKGACKDIISAIEASASMPLLSRVVTIAGKKYVDGSVAMPIAYEKAIEEGYKKVVVVLTRHRNYKKKPIRSFKVKAYQKYFLPFPRLFDTLSKGPQRYNQHLSRLSQLEREHKVFIIRPKQVVKVTKVERNKRKLKQLYEEGRLVATEQLEELLTYLHS